MLFLRGFASSAATHCLELLVRLVVGLAFLVQAPSAATPASFTTLGWALVATTACLLLVPWRWHRKFAQRTVPQVLRYLSLIAVVSLLMGGIILWSALLAGT